MGLSSFICGDRIVLPDGASASLREDRNQAHDDAGKDVAHGIVYEIANLITLFVFILISSMLLPEWSSWPQALPIVVWDRLLGTFRLPSARRPGIGDIGIQDCLHFPQVYSRQLTLPFDPAGPCAEASPTKASTINADPAW